MLILAKVEIIDSVYTTHQTEIVNIYHRFLLRIKPIAYTLNSKKWNEIFGLSPTEKISKAQIDYIFMNKKSETVTGLMML